MEYLAELSRLPQKEIKERLDKNKHIAPESFVSDGNKIYRVISRRDKKVWVTPYYRELSPVSLILDIETVVPLGYEIYREFISRKYTTGTVFQTLEILIKYLNKTLKKIYGEDNIEVIQILDSNFIIKVYFPEIVVKNSLGLEHTMTDVYLDFTFYYNSSSCKVSYKRTDLWRETYTPGEINYGYMFSHIGTAPGKSTTHWCYGDTSFGIYLKRITGQGIHPKDIAFLIQQTKAYMEWESLEGTPYRHISKIKPYAFTPASNDPPYNGGYITTMYNKVIEELEDFNYDIDYTLNGFEISIRSSRIKDIVNKHVKKEFKVRNVDGISGEIKALTVKNTKFSNTSLYRFKGLDKLPKIIPDKNEFDMEKLDEIYPLEAPQELIDEVIFRLLTEYKEFLIKHKLEND